MNSLLCPWISSKCWWLKLQSNHMFCDPLTNLMMKRPPSVKDAAGVKDAASRFLHSLQHVIQLWMVPYSPVPCHFRWKVTVNPHVLLRSYKPDEEKTPFPSASVEDAASRFLHCLQRVIQLWMVSYSSMPCHFHSNFNFLILFELTVKNS